MSAFKNWNCDGGRCRAPGGPVKVYLLGAGGNLILCEECFKHENRYRAERGRETKQPENWPQVLWTAAEDYKS